MITLRRVIELSKLDTSTSAEPANQSSSGWQLSQSLFGSQPWSSQPSQPSQPSQFSQSSRSSLRAPIVTPDQRAQRKEFSREYRRRLKEARDKKKDQEGKFAIDLKQWLKSGIIVAGVNVLKYEDPDGKLHRASILPNGKLQANIRKAPVFASVRQWLKTVLDLNGPGTNWRLAWELKRVTYRRRSMSHWFAVFRREKEDERDDWI